MQRWRRSLRGCFYVVWLAAGIKEINNFFAFFSSSEVLRNFFTLTDMSGEFVCVLFVYKDVFFLIIYAWYTIEIVNLQFFRIFSIPK